jgi:hypothetical protein
MKGFGMETYESVKPKGETENKKRVIYLGWIKGYDQS